MVTPESEIAENDVWPFSFMLSKPAFYCAVSSKAGEFDHLRLFD